MFFVPLPPEPAGWSWIFLFLIHKDLRKNFTTHSSHLLLFGESFSWFPLTVGLLGALLLGSRVKVSTTPGSSSCAKLLLIPQGIHPTGFFFVQRLKFLGKII